MQLAHRLSYGYQRLTLWFLTVSAYTIISLMPYHAFLSTWLGTMIGPLLVFKSWKELLLALMVLAALGFGVLRPRLAKQLLLSPVVLLMLVYTLLFVGLAFLYQHPLEPTIAGLLFNLRFFAVFVLAQALLLAWPQRTALMRRWLAAGLLISAAIVSLIAILQVTVIPPTFLTMFGYDEDLTIAPFSTIDQQMSALRAFATLRGPNELGMFLLLPLAILAAYIVRGRHFKYAVPAFVLGIIALFLSHSRSAWIGAVVAAVVLGAVLLGRQRLWQYTRRYGLYVLVAMIALATASVTYAPLRLAVFHSSPGDPSLIEGSTLNHFIATANGAADAAAHPLGRGPGQAGPASYYGETPRVAENYYVQIAQEGGVIALALLLVILYLVARRLWRAAVRPNAPPLVIGLLASFWGIAAINLLLHGWADGPTAITWWGLAGLALTPDNSKDG